ncbi:formate dehydrogenase subunit delta [Neomegalonema sp.]|uniref:formate dehydrogenase subunit delta n=1 Tax=Neomegalonema sp. TaxID=2039713 RepID=UPI002603C9D2|nr:formate dehydrogenase subunit delta [Neomegalonema sp.]MDD2867307.1 formate dehydrogenase subunit delta [Neomegalonema sp.]
MSSEASDAQHHADPAARLIHMANQIARTMETRRDLVPAEGLASHINDFWEPRMRRKLFELLAAQPEALRPLVHEAAPLIRKPPPEGA